MRGDKVFVISGEEVAKMRGGVYRHRNSFKVYFKGDWFYHDEYGRPFKAEFYAYTFLDLLNSLYDPDPAKNRYDPSRFKSHTPYKFDEAFALYLDRKVTDSGWHRAKEWTWKKYFMPYFTNQDFRTIDQVQLEAFLQFLQGKGLKGKTIRNIFMALHGFLNHFKQSISLFPQFPDLSYQRPRIRWFTEKEIDQVFEFIQMEDRGYFLFIRYYGVRPEEASGLLRNAMNWETGEILISSVFVNGKIRSRTKTKMERILPIELAPEVIPYLKRDPAGKSQRSTGRGNGVSPAQPDSLFVFHVAGHPYTRHIRERRWNAAMKQAQEKYGTRAMTLRDLRHSFATHLRQHKVPLDIIRRLLGHSTQEITDQFYADLSPHDIVEIVRGK